MSKKIIKSIGFGVFLPISIHIAILQISSRDNHALTGSYEHVALKVPFLYLIFFFYHKLKNNPNI